MAAQQSQDSTEALKEAQQALKQAMRRVLDAEAARSEVLRRGARRRRAT